MFRIPISSIILETSLDTAAVFSSGCNHNVHCVWQSCLGFHRELTIGFASVKWFLFRSPPSIFIISTLSLFSTLNHLFSSQVLPFLLVFFVGASKNSVLNSPSHLKLTSQAILLSNIPLYGCSTFCLSIY